MQTKTFIERFQNVQETFFRSAFSWKLNVLETFLKKKNFLVQKMKFFFCLLIMYKKKKNCEKKFRKKIKCKQNYFT